ncbi:SPOR domain-containing protein [Andreprevotia chitinilytica]|uniref:SPOR domain-containing protein n=1 Tax=Andreprevotia chitinilytica TaxID=396808 RepID=UPI00054F549E|nr:SPOR domain-containing protein [Andreprevotia chitinilytica]
MSDGFDPILQQAEQRRLREQVLWRLGIAAGLIAVVLGGIYLLDRPDEKPKLETPVATPRIAPQASEPEVIAASEPASAPAIASQPASAAAVTPSTLPVTQVPATNAPTVAPTAAQTPLIRPITKLGKTTVLPEVEEAQAPAKATITAAPRTANNALPGNLVRRTPTPNESLLEPQTLLTGPSHFEATRGPNGYTVQAGVFLHSDNAEKLLQKLQAAGIPAYLETRVQIGPFKNKAEADAAAAKLRALGIEPVLKNSN